MSHLQNCLASLAVAAFNNDLLAFVAGQNATNDYVAGLPRDEPSKRAGLMRLKDEFAALMLDSATALALRDDIICRIDLIDIGAFEQKAERLAGQWQPVPHRH